MPLAKPRPSMAALIGQPVRRFDELFGLYSPQQIEQLALDRTSESQMYSAGVSRPFGERWQWSLDASTMTLGSTRESGGVPATPSSGTDTAVSTQVLGYGLFGRGDVTSLGLQYQTGENAQMLSLGVGTRSSWGRCPIRSTWSTRLSRARRGPSRRGWRAWSGWVTGSRCRSPAATGRR